VRKSGGKFFGSLKEKSNRFPNGNKKETDVSEKSMRKNKIT
jgi:hypothetical protein